MHICNWKTRGVLQSRQASERRRTASRRYWGICVVLPHPVSPSMIRTWCPATADSKSSLNGKIGRLRRVSSIDVFFLNDSDTSFYNQPVVPDRFTALDPSKQHNHSTRMIPKDDCWHLTTCPPLFPNGATTGGSGGPDPQNLDGPPQLFWWRVWLPLRNTLQSTKLGIPSVFCSVQ